MCFLRNLSNNSPYALALVRNSNWALPLTNDCEQHRVHARAERWLMQTRPQPSRVFMFWVLDLHESWNNIDVCFARFFQAFHRKIKDNKKWTTFFSLHGSATLLLYRIYDLLAVLFCRQIISFCKMARQKTNKNKTLNLRPWHVRFWRVTGFPFFKKSHKLEAFIYKAGFVKWLIEKKSGFDV